MHDLNFISLKFLVEGTLVIHFFNTSPPKRVSRTETNKEDEKGVARPEQSRMTDQINDITGRTEQSVRA